MAMDPTLFRNQIVSDHFTNSRVLKRFIDLIVRFRNLEKADRRVVIIEKLSRVTF